MPSFSSVFVSDVPSSVADNQRCVNIIGILYVTPLMIEDIIGKLDGNSSMGGDGIHPRLLKNLSSILSTPLSIIFNSTLDEGLLPVEWVSSVVVPIYKNSSRCNPLNYRPVSLTSVTCKVMEKAIVSHLTEFISENSLLSDYQFGFRSGHSTVDQLLATYNDVTGYIDQGKVVDLLFFDYSKAFDKVRHVILLQKLADLGICPQILNWISYFLRARTMRVRISGVLSHSEPVTSGVPQGSVLGPVLFLLYVNYVVANLTCKYKIFADDIKLYLSFETNNFSEGTEVAQNNIDILVKTSSSWGLTMNTSKCVCMRFSPKNCMLPCVGPSPYKIGLVIIDFVESHSDLGITVDRTMKFHSHVARNARIANGITSNILSCTLERDEDFILNIFKFHVGPIMEYGSPLWNVGYRGDMKIMERVQRRWTRAINGISDLPYSTRLNRLKLFSFQGHLLHTDLIMVWKIFHNKCALKFEDFFHLDIDSHTRGHQFKIFVPRVSLEVRKRYFSVRVISAWNSLTDEAVSSVSLGSFKRLLQRDLGQQLYDYLD